VVLEIRAGTGGDEASLFAAEVFRMYSRFAEQHRWKVEVLSSSESSVGGLKEVIAIIEGNRVYSQMKYESGVHRVQRVPATETQGRVHTSAITVAVLPEVEDVDVKIEAKDLRIDTFCSSGSRRAECEHDVFCGADYASAVEYGGELPGREVADQKPRKGDAGFCARGCTKWRWRSSRRRWRRSASSRWGRGIGARRFGRTNFPQNRLTDHRIGLTIHQLSEMMEGKLQPVIDALIAHL
jgi:peptide chain release factor 1